MLRSAYARAPLTSAARLAPIFGMGAPSGLSVDRLDSSVLPVWHIAPSAVLSASTARRYVAAYGLPNLVAQFDQLAALLIQMSGVRLEQRKQDLIGHGEVMLNAIHLAPARIRLRNT